MKTTEDIFRSKEKRRAVALREPASPSLFGRPKIIKWRKIVIVTMAFVLIGSLAGTAFYYYRQYKKIVESPRAMVEKEGQELVEKIGKIMDLPTDEQPTIATVTDKEKVKDQPFFAKAENGDKVLIYTKAKKAILYRPSQNRIIEVAALSETK